MRRKQYIIAVMMMAIYSLSGCSQSIPTITTPDLIDPVNIIEDSVRVTREDIINMDVIEGIVEPDLTELNFPISGIFKEWHVVIGDRVKQGDVLGELDETVLLEEVERLNTAYEDLIKANQESNNMLHESITIANLQIKQKEAQIKELKKTNTSSDLEEGATDETKNEDEIKKQILALTTEVELLKIDIEGYQLTLKQNEELQNMETDKLKKELDAAKLKIGSNQLIAPFDGEVVAMVEVWGGNQITADKPVMALADTTIKQIKTPYVSEASLQKVDRYYAIINGVETDVTYVPYDADELAALKVSGATIKSGWQVDQSIPLEYSDLAMICIVKEYHENTLTIPAESLYVDNTGSYVYRIKEGIRERVPVAVGIRNVMSVEILEGLEEGDEVHVKN